MHDPSLDGSYGAGGGPTLQQFLDSQFFHYLVKKNGNNYIARKWNGTLSYNSTDVFAAIQAAVDGLPTGAAGGLTKGGHIGIWPPDDGSDMMGQAAVSRSNTLGVANHGMAPLTKSCLITVPDNSQVSFVTPIGKTTMLRYTGTDINVRMLQTNPGYMSVAETGNALSTSSSFNTKSSFLKIDGLSFDIALSGYADTCVMIENTKNFEIPWLTVRNNDNPNPPNPASVAIDFKNHNGERSTAGVLSVNRFAKGVRQSAEHITINNIFAGETTIAGFEINTIPYMVNLKKIMGFHVAGNLILNSSLDQTTRYGNARGITAIGEIMDEGHPDESTVPADQYPSKGAVVHNVNPVEMIIGKLQQRHQAGSPHSAMFSGQVGFIKLGEWFYEQGIGEDGFMRKYKGGIAYSVNQRLLDRMPLTAGAPAEALGTITYGMDADGGYEDCSAAEGSLAGVRYADMIQRRIPHYVVYECAPSVITSIREFWGASNQTISGQVNTEITPAGTAQYAGVAIDRSVNGNYHIIARDGSNIRDIDTGIAVTTTPVQAVIQQSHLSGRGGLFIKLISGGATANYYKLLYQWPNQSDAAAIQLGSSTNLHYLHAHKTLAGAGGSRSIKNYGFAIHRK